MRNPLTAETRRNGDHAEKSKRKSKPCATLTGVPSRVKVDGARKSATRGSRADGGVRPTFGVFEYGIVPYLGWPQDSTWGV